jgi:hypothetical protein
MTSRITNALKVLAASAMLVTAIASPSLAQSARYGARSYGYYGYQHQDTPAERDQHRRDWDY